MRSAVFFGPLSRVMQEKQSCVAYVCVCVSVCLCACVDSDSDSVVRFRYRFRYISRFVQQRDTHAYDVGSQTMDPGPRTSDDGHRAAGGVLQSSFPTLLGFFAGVIP